MNLPKVTKTSWNSPGNWIALGGIVSAFPLMILQIGALWDKPQMRFFGFAWLFFALFCAYEPRVGFASSPLRRYFSVAMTISGVVFSLLAVFLIAPALSQLAIILFILGWMLLCWGIVPWTRLVALTGLLWVTWIPFSIDTRMIDWLFGRAATMLGPLMDLIGTPNLLQQLQLDLRSERIDLALSVYSWNSVFLLAFVAILLLLWMRRPFLQGLFALASIPVLGWLMYSIKILLLIWGRESFSADWSVGWMGVFINVGLFVLSSIFLLIVIDALSFLFEPLPVELSQQATVGLHGFYNRLAMWPGSVTFQGEEQVSDDYFDDDEAPRKQQASTRSGPTYRDTIRATDPWASSGWRTPLTVGLLGVAILGAVGALLPSSTDGVTMPTFTNEQLDAIGSLQTLPAESRGLKQAGVERSEHDLGSGVKSQLIVWRYAGAEGLPVVLADFPYVGQQQYWSVPPGVGWKMSSQPKRLSIAREANGQPWPIVEVEYVNDLQSIAYAWYSAFDSSGSAAVPESGWRADWKRRFSRTLIGRLLGRAAKEQVTYQTRLFLDSGKPITAGRRADYQAFMVETTEALKARLLGS